MRGHEPFIAMRRRGQKPAEFAEVLMQAWPVARGSTVRADCVRWFRQGRIFVEPGDAIDRLDLRFLFGCDVMVDGDDAERTRRLYAALQRHKARRVIANCGRVVNGHGRLDFVLDTQEVLTWHA